MDNHEGMYRKVLGINMTSKRRPLMIFPTHNKVTVTCGDDVLLDISREEFDNMTVNEIVATWDNEDDGSQESNEESSQ